MRLSLLFLSMLVAVTWLPVGTSSNSTSRCCARAAVRAVP
jgi:hypothetical protein